MSGTGQTDLGTIGGREFDIGYAGQELTSAPAVRLSRIVENAEGLAWGSVAAQGANGGCVPFDASHTQILGIAKKQPMHPSVNGVAKYQQYDSATILEEGDTLILAAEDARDGDQVVILNPSPEDANTGKFGSSKGGAANGTTRIAMPGTVTYEGAATAGQLAKIRLRQARAARTTT